MKDRLYCNRTVIAEHLKNSTNYVAVVGPCSIQSAQAARLVAEELKSLQARVPKECLIVMRAYLDKPRTATGWRGLLYSDPVAASTVLHQCADLIPIAIEAVDYVALERLCDNGLDNVASLVAIGARTSESQTHRVYASSLKCAVGVKNPVDYNIAALGNGLKAVRSQWEYVTDDLLIEKTEGCPSLTFGIIRGGRSQDPSRKHVHRPLSCDTLNAAAHTISLSGASAIVDVSHDNAKAYSDDPRYGQQLAMDALLHSMKYTRGLGSVVRGFMAEMHIEEGQSKDMAQHTKSVTDYCMSPRQLEEMILKWHETYMEFYGL
jgi:3-deoxy-7-phosphoheptulonate synthase